MLLSRTADDLYWLARYIERAENNARILDAANRLAALPANYGGKAKEWEAAVHSTGNSELFYEMFATANRENVIAFIGFSEDNPSSIRSCIGKARASARAVRTAITREMWSTINDAWLELRRYRSGVLTGRQLREFLDFVKEACLRFDGSAYRTMLRSDAHAFFRLGTYVERGDATTRILDARHEKLVPEAQPIGGKTEYFQWSSILRAASALTAYQWVFRDSVRPERVAELLTVRSELPRSISFCARNCMSFLDELSYAYGHAGPAQRAARAHHAELQNTTIDAIYEEGMHAFLLRALRRNGQLSEMIAAQYLH